MNFGGNVLVSGLARGVLLLDAEGNIPAIFLPPRRVDCGLMKLHETTSRRNTSCATLWKSTEKGGVVGVS